MAPAARAARSRDSETRRGGDIPVSLLSSVELFNVLVPEKSVEGGLDGPLTLQMQRPSASRRPAHSTSLLKSIRLEVCREDCGPPPLAEERSDSLDACSQRNVDGRRHAVLYSRCSAPAIHPSWYNLNEQMTSSTDTVRRSADGGADATALILKFYACPARDDDDDTTRTEDEPGCEPFLQLPLNHLVRIQLDDKLRITDLLPVNAVLVQFATHSHTHSHEPYNRSDDYSSSSLRPSSWYISPALYDVLIELTPSPLLSNAVSRSDAPTTSWNGVDSRSSAEKKQESQFFDDTLFDVLDKVAEPESGTLSTEPPREGRRPSDADQDLPRENTPVSSMIDDVETDAGFFPCDEDAPMTSGDSSCNPDVGAAPYNRAVEENRELRARVQEEREALQRDLERLQQSRDDGGGPSVRDLQCRLETLRAQTAEISRASTEVLEQASKLAFLLHAQRIRLVRELRSLYPIELVPLAASGAPPHPPARFTIRGLELPAALLGSPSSPSQGWNLAPNEEDTFSAAMGYLCHVVVRLGEYLGVPLRHRLCCQSSRSVVQDGATGACYPLFAAPRQPYHHPSPEREKLLAGWDRLQSNVDALMREVDGVGAKSGGAAPAGWVPPTHILAKVRRVYDVVTLGR